MIFDVGPDEANGLNQFSFVDSHLQQTGVESRSVDVKRISEDVEQIDAESRSMCEQRIRTNGEDRTDLKVMNSKRVQNDFIYLKKRVRMACDVNLSIRANGSYPIASISCDDNLSVDEEIELVLDEIKFKECWKCMN